MVKIMMIKECPACMGLGEIWYTDINNHGRLIVKHRICKLCNNRGYVAGDIQQ